MDNKKKIIVSVIGIIILLVMVVGVTYAMYTYTGTGSKENVITTGNISVSYAESKVVNLENTYPMSDALGIQGTESSEMKFTVTGNITGNVTINYAIGLDAIEEGETLKDEYVKIYMLKGNTVVSTFTEGVGTLISELEQNYVDGQLGSYALYTDSFTEEGITSQEYTIKAWVSEEYDLPGDDETKVGDTISKGTTSETFKFKIKVVATDQRLVIGNDNTGPTIESFTHLGDGVINVIATDASGLNGICINNNATDVTGCSWETYTTGTYEGELSTSGTYYAHLRDTIGNISHSSSLIISNLDTSNANAPELATGMIPVYYDSTSKVWRKADSRNGNASYKWYNYDEHMWANAITYDHTKATDLSGNNNTGTLMNNAKYTNTGMYFDGVDDYINAGNVRIDLGSSLTVAVRAKLDADRIDTYSQIISNTQGGGFCITYVNSTNNLRLMIHNGTEYIYVNYPIVLDSNTWYNIVATYDGANAKLYLNGELVGTTATTGSIKVSSGTPILIGAEPTTDGLLSGGYDFKGTISDALIIKEALSASTIASNYGTSFNYQENANTLFYYNLRGYEGRENGSEVLMEDINTMLVWIPRFTVNTGELSTQAYFESIRGVGTACSWDNTQTCYLNPSAIDVTFVDTNTEAIDAFTFGSQNLTGYWVGKFETTGTLASACTTETCNISNVTIKPNTASLVGHTVSSLFYTIRSMEQASNQYGLIGTEVDTHMMKNSEWGAVTYLTQSNYGRCTSNVCSEVWKNPVNTLRGSTYYGSTITGCSGTSVSAAVQNSMSACTSGYEYNGINNNGNSSTTGNIYGIYDMSGGNNEYVMGNLNNTISYSNFSSIPESKYINIYTETTYTGHALTETAGWYSDRTNFVNADNPWFVRGGSHGNSDTSGVFYFHDFNGVGCYGSGYSYCNIGARLSVTKYKK